MLVPVVALLLQLSATTAAPAPTLAAGTDTSVAKKDTAASEKRRPAKRDSVTVHHLATAYRGKLAQDILTLARRARTTQDSLLTSYEATTYQRISAGFSLTRFGRDRLAFRTESATRVKWQRGVGAYVDVTGSRTVVPIAGRSAHVDLGQKISPIPYYPGSETLWVDEIPLERDVDENQGIVHPLANGSEAYYTYEAGDSITVRLPDGTSTKLRELRVRPRTPKWNLAVGSLWFDMRGGQLVRAAYRMAVPVDIASVAHAEDSTSFDDVPFWMKPMMFPMTAQVSAIGVEYGLFQGRLWLRRLQVAEGGVTAGPMRLPFKLEQRYDYASVNASSSLPPIPVARDSARKRADSVSVTVNVVSRAGRDSARAARRRAQCDSTGTHTYTRGARDSVNIMFVRVPCDSAKLAHSPDLPPSIYESGEQLADGGEMDALVKQALSLSAQADFAPQAPLFSLQTPRYNRVEGLSVGGRVDQQLGAGYSTFTTARIGLADLQPGVEVSIARSDLRRTLTLTGYNRLVSANDYDNAFGLSNSLSALLFARDEGYYYRTSGVELTSAPDQSGGQLFSWTMFAEQERSAPRRTSFAVARGLTGFRFDSNLVATRGVYYGVRTRLASTFGRNPESARLFSDIQLEGAYGDTGSYGRIALDLALSRAIGRAAVALTLAGGTSVGVLPVQRNWFIGGAQTVRGQHAALEPGRMGNAFWLARGEIAHGLGVVRPMAFVDVGWAGDRTTAREIGRPNSGAGVGLSMLDGLLHFDVARGIFPDKGWRVYSYVEGRF